MESSTWEAADPRFSGAQGAGGPNAFQVKASALRPGSRLSKGGADRRHETLDSDRERALRTAFIIILFPLIYLQKIGIPLGGDQQVSITILPYYAGVAYALAKGAMRVNLLRFCIYLMLLISMIASQLMSGVVISPLGLMLILILYFPFVAEARISPEQYRELSEVFQNLMILPCVMVFPQLIFEFASHYHTLSLEPLLPKAILMQGFIYEAPYHFGQPFIRANGFFMLEPSFIAMFAAVALCVEVSLRRRGWRMALYAGAMLASLGATGYLMMAVALPFLLLRLPARVSVAFGVLALVGVVGAVATGAAGAVLNRMVELGTPGTSGYGRITLPFQQLIDAAGRPETIVTGVGAGNIEKGPSTWPFTRVALEYGFISAFAFLALELVACIGSPVAAVAASLFVVFNFTGGYLPNPVPVILIYTLIAAVRVERRSRPAPVGLRPPSGPFRMPAPVESML